jgi:uncharacterized membrane protein
MRTRTDNDAGQMLPLVALMMVLAAATALAVGTGGRVVVARAQAQTAADAAALAGAAEGPEAARELADRNGATLVRFEVRSTDTLVEVAVGPVRAEARARRG